MKRLALLSLLALAVSANMSADFGDVLVPTAVGAGIGGAVGGGRGAGIGAGVGLGVGLMNSASRDRDRAYNRNYNNYDYNGDYGYRTGRGYQSRYINYYSSDAQPSENAEWTRFPVSK